MNEIERKRLEIELAYQEAKAKEEMEHAWRMYEMAMRRHSDIVALMNEYDVMVGKAGNDETE